MASALMVSAVVSEMCGRRRSRMGVSWAQHEAAANAFAAGPGLAACASMAVVELVDTAAEADRAGAAAGDPLSGSAECAWLPPWRRLVVTEAARTVTLALRSASGVRRGTDDDDDDDDTASASSPHRLPPGMARLALDGRLLAAAATLLRSLRGCWGSSLPQDSRRLLAALANASAAGFTPESGGDAALQRHVSTCLDALLPLASRPLLRSLADAGLVPADAARLRNPEVSRLATASDAERVQASSAVARLASAVGFAGWQRADESLRAAGRPGLFAALADVHAAVLAAEADRCRALQAAVAAGAAVNAALLRDAAPASLEAHQALLLAWATLVDDAVSLAGDAASMAPAARGPGSRRVSMADSHAAAVASPVLAPLVGACARVFEGCVRVRAETAELLVRCGEDGEGDPTGEEGRFGDEMESLALVGRACPAASVALVSAALRAAAEASHAVRPGTPAVEAAVVHERLSWALSFASHLLADSGRGETPTVPPTLVALSRATPHGAACPVVTLVKAVVRVAEAEAARAAAPATRGGLSPVVAESCASAVRRVSATYILPQADSSLDGETSDALDEAFSREGRAAAWTGRVTANACSLLAAWPGEASVAAEAVSALLIATCRKQRARVVASSGQWAAVHAAFESAVRNRIRRLAVASPAVAAALAADAAALGLVGGPGAHPSALPELASLPEAVFAELAEAVGAGTRGLDNHDGSREAAFSGPLRLLDAWARAADAAGGADLSAALSALAGFVVRATPRAEWCLGLIGPRISATAAVVGRSGSSSPQARAALAFARTVMDWMLPELGAAHTAAVCAHLDALFRVVGGEAGKAARATAAAAAGDEDEEADAMESVLVLLRAVASKSSFDMSDVPASPAEAAASAAALAACAITGIQAAVARLGPAALGRPDVATSFGATLGKVASEFAASIAALPAASSASLVGALATAAAHHDASVATAGVRALGALADALIDAGAGGRAAMAPLLAGLPAAVLKRALASYESPSLVSAAGHVLVSCCVVSPEAVRDALGQLASAQGSGALGSRVASSCAALLDVLAPAAAEAGKASPSLRRQQSIRMAARFAEFCAAVGPLLHTM